jgi:sphingomyelin phosphodiesterase acid-like 3
MMSKPGSKNEQGLSNGDGRERLPGLTRRNFLKYSAGAVAGVCFGSILSGCGGGGGSVPDPTFPVVVFSDIHFNPFYDPTLFPTLMTTDPSGWKTTFEGSGITAPSTWGYFGGTHFDSNYPLLARTLDAVKRNLGASPLVIYTGDILGHLFSTLFYGLIHAEDPAHPTADQVAAMQGFADKTVSFVMREVRSVVGNVPVLFALGNCDSYTGNGPDSIFLSNAAPLFYRKFLNGITDEQTFLSTFTGGGYYSAEIPDLNLTVIGLSTFQYSPSSTGTTPNGIDAQLTWLDGALASARTAGRKVWLLTHLPPGADEATTAQSISGGRISNATMLWDTTKEYQTSFLNILANYPGLVTFILGAHTHNDEYRILSTGQVLDIAGGISPLFGNNPAFKVYTFDGTALNATDYISFNLDPSAASPQFNDYYTFSTAYGLRGSLNNSLTQLYPLLKTNSAKQSFYRTSYPSGHAYSTPVGLEVSPITDQTWPVYWAGIGNMDSGGLVDAVNSY